MAQQAGERALIVGTGDLQRHTEAVAVAARRHAGVAWAPVSAKFDIDPLAQAIAEVAVSADAELRETWEELAAATIPVMPADTPGPAGLAGAAHTDIDAAARRHQALLSSEAAVPPLREQLDSATQRGNALHKELDNARAHASTLEAERALSESKLATLKTTLDSARGEFETLRTERDAQVAELRSTLDSAHTNLAQLHAERDAEVAELRQELSSHRQSIRRLREKLAADIALKQSIQRESDRRLLRLHQVQAELEHYFEAHQVLARVDGVRRTALERIEIGTIDFGAAQLTQPYRHIDITLAEVAYGSRRLQRIDSRFVQHHGRPGLLIFAPVSGATPLSAWTPTGQENGRPFMLLIPSDPASVATLSALGTSDWGFVVDLTEQLSRACADERAAIRDAWHPLALRMLGELRHMPPRLRYDGVVPVQAEAGNRQEITARFEQVLAGDRAATGLLLQWRPDCPSGEAALHLQALPADDHRPRVLDAWPLGDDGRWAAAMPLPLGPGLDSVQVRHAWDGLTDADRAGIVSLLDALPAAIRARRDDELPPGWPRARLQVAAAKLASAARRARAGAKWRQWLRAAKRRLPL